MLQIAGSCADCVPPSAMSRYHCTYTHMKSQKRKKWQDGVVVMNDSKLEVLPLRESEDPSTKAGPVLDTYYLTSADALGGIVGKSLETERFLVEVGDEIATTASTVVAKPVPTPPQPSTSKRFSVGLKRSGSVNSSGAAKPTAVLDSFTSTAAFKDVFPPPSAAFSYDDDVNTPVAAQGPAQIVPQGREPQLPPLTRRTISEIFDLFRSNEPRRTLPPPPQGLYTADLAVLRYDVPAWCYDEDLWTRPTAPASKWDALVAPTFAKLATFTEPVVCGGLNALSAVAPCGASTSSAAPCMPSHDERWGAGYDDWQQAIDTLRPKGQPKSNAPAAPTSQARSTLAAASSSGFKPPVSVSRATPPELEGLAHRHGNSFVQTLASDVVFPPLSALEQPASKAGKPCVGLATGPCGDPDCVACLWHRVHIPTTFTSLKQYISVMKSALVHEMNRQLASVALTFRKTVAATLPKGVPVPSATQSTSLFRALRGKRVMFYSKCELIIHYPNTYFKDRGFGGSPQAKPTGSRPSALYLKLDPSEMEKSTEYAKDDLWILSTVPTMPYSANSAGLSRTSWSKKRARTDNDGGGEDTSELSNCLVFRSAYHGPSSRGSIELLPVLPGSAYPQLGNRKAIHVFAIRGPNVASDVNMFVVLEGMASLPCPLAPVLVKGLSGGREASATIIPSLLPGQASVGINFDDVCPSNQTQPAGKPPSERDPFELDISEAEISSVRERIVAQFTLNADQAAVLSAVQDWFCPAGTTQATLPCDAPVTLVHGVFGSGKSHLLVATITLLSELFDHSKCRDVQKPQVCLASATNVAVDNVLLALQRAGYQDFARVGSVKKIAKSILPVAAHAAGPETTRAIADMKFMMAASGRNAVSGAEREAVADAISKLETKKNRSEELMSRRVIGVTCAATAVAVLEHRRFAVVLLDEASQMVEPASLLSVARFAARRLLAVGDPLQLPPTLPSSPVYRSESADAAGGHSLERTLFERLAQNGIRPIMLRTQYRCHPVFSSLSSAHFYQGQLVDGITADQRPALIARAPPLIFYDCTGGSERVGYGGSIVNDTEARIVAQLVNELLSAGIESPSIGIICLYKAQCDAVSDAMRTAVTDFDATGVQVSTVDAFQGAERDVIIVSCCRTEKLGFIVSARRLNVALSRARHHLIVVGHRETLSGNVVWKSVIETAAKTPGGIRGIGRRPLLLPSM